MRSEIVTEEDRFAALAPAWNRLADLCGSPLLRHEWFFAGWQALHEGDRLSIVLVWDGPDLRAIAPLAVVAGRRLRRLELIGVARLNEPCDLLATGSDSVSALLAAIGELGLPVVLQRLPAASLAAAGYRQLPRSRGLALFRPARSAQAVAIDTDWDTYYRTLSSRRRYDHRRARKRAEAQGGVGFEMLSPADDQVDSGLARLFAVEAASWKGRRGSALATRGDLGEFFSTFARSAARQGRLRLCFLTVGGHDAAAQLAVETADRFWVLKIGYDERWADCSPGVLLTLEAIRWCFANDRAVYEFLGSEEQWIGVWANRLHRYQSIGFYPLSRQGVGGLLHDASRFARSTADRLRSSLLSGRPLP
ncbi:GNAT family N-acetyltransferase [bacterium]|nr:GNAT family N-acetyltransferase [bacterium]